jgi:hypothetical protein
MGTLRAFAALCVLSFASHDAKANFFSDLAGIATDPLKLGKLVDGVERSLIQIEQLEKQGDAIAQQRLEQLKDIVAFAIQGGQTVVDQAAAKLANLEDQIDNDAKQLIYRAECAAVVALNDQFQHAIVEATQNIGKASPTITIFGIPIIKFRTSKVTIDNPDQAYKDTKKRLMPLLPVARLVVVRRAGMV